MLTEIPVRRLLTGGGEIEWPLVSVEDGRIVKIEAGAARDSEAGAGETLTAAFFDVHVHGAVSHDFMTATAEEVGSAGRFLATRGVAHFLPTTVTGPLDMTLRALEALATAIEEGWAGEPAALPVGIHLEGPFLSHAKRGVQPEAYLEEPSVALFERYQEAARGHIRLMTIAPELPRALELIEHVSGLGVRVSLGHSDATAAEAMAGIASGAVSATHTFNAMRAMDHREPGIAAVVLGNEALYAEMICDGVHVHPEMVRLWLKMKGEERGILVTDGISAVGMPEGRYWLGEMEVEVKDGVCMAGGLLAGSVLTMDRAVANLREFTGSSLGMAVRLASRNPAAMVGMEDRVRVDVGDWANFNVYDRAGERSGAILRGHRVWPRRQQRLRWV
jgi:N-acetylglucosamine-6-phosphate deacetylase